MSPLTHTRAASEADADALEAEALDEAALQEKLEGAVERQRHLEKDLYGQAQTELPDNPIVKGPHYRVASVGPKIERALEATETRINDLEVDLSIRAAERRTARRQWARKARWLFLAVPVAMFCLAMLTEYRVGFFIGGCIGGVLTLLSFYFARYQKEKWKRTLDDSQP